MLARSGATKLEGSGVGVVALSGHGVQLEVRDPEEKGPTRSYGYFCPGDADLAGRACVAVGHVGGALFMTHQHVPNRIVEQGVVGRQECAARIPEHRCHLLGNQRLPDHLGSRPLHACLPQHV